MGRVAVLAYLASLEALEHARISDHYFGSGRLGVSFASTMGSTGSIKQFFKACLEKSQVGEIPANIFFQCMSHTCAANIAQALGITGRVLSPNAACASSLQAIGCGMEAIQQGDQDIVICGGADELDATTAACFDLVRAASSHFNDEPQRTPRPFDKDRDGIVCGEGAGALVLESQESAEARGAKILAEVAGYATTSDGTHLAQPHSESIIACLEKALDVSGFRPDYVEYVNAHATGTMQGDREEAEALQQVFGARSVPVSSLKGHFGHTLGACGAIELIACLRMQENGYLLPTMNLETPGEGCEGLDHVTTLRRACFDRFAKNSFAFGGINAVLMLRRNRA